MAKLVRLCTVRLAIPVATTIIAFGASLVAGAVVCTAVTPYKVEQLFRCACTTKKDCAGFDEIVSFVKAEPCKTAFVQKWRRTEHINNLEACRAYMAVEWIVSMKISACKVFTFSDSQSSHWCLHERNIEQPRTCMDLQTARISLPSAWYQCRVRLHTWRAQFCKQPIPRGRNSTPIEAEAQIGFKIGKRSRQPWGLACECVSKSICYVRTDRHADMRKYVNVALPYTFRKNLWALCQSLYQSMFSGAAWVRSWGLNHWKLRYCQKPLYAGTVPLWQLSNSHWNTVQTQIWSQVWL